MLRGWANYHREGNNTGASRPLPAPCSCRNGTRRFFAGATAPRSKDEGGPGTNRGSGFWLQQSIIKERREKGVASMANFPRSSIGGLSVSRMIIGTNWFLGYCHDTKAKGEFITRHVTNCESIAAIIEVFLRAGVDTIMTPWQRQPQLSILHDAIASAEDRTGIKAIKFPPYSRRQRY